MNELKNLRKYELEIVRLEESNKELQSEVNSEKAMITKLEEKLLTFYSEEQYKELEEKYAELDKKRFETARYYENKIKNMQKEIDCLKMENLCENKNEAE